jgi:hypothetical protein
MLFTVITIVFVSRHALFFTRGATLTRCRLDLAATIFLREHIWYECHRIQQRTLNTLSRTYLHVYVSVPAFASPYDKIIRLTYCLPSNSAYLYWDYSYLHPARFWA